MIPDHHQPAAVRTALAYHRAWTDGDLELAMTHVAEDIVCLAPAGRLEGAGAFRGFMGPFVGILTGSELLAVYGDDRTAVVVYNPSTIPVAEAPTCELVTVRDDRIVEMRIIFDRLPFDAARKAAAAGPE
jgi:ketosteroid isomerase-like protein